MAQRTGNKAPPYSEALTRAWLAWLARGMQQHGQTVFMVEQLQPSWLGTSSERVVYAISTRSIVGSFYGMIFGVVWSVYFESIAVILPGVMFGFISGISVGLLDAFRLPKREPKASPESPTPSRRLKSIAIVAGVLFLTFCALGALLLLAFFLQGDVLDSEFWTEIIPVLLIFAVVSFLPIFALIWGIRSSRRTLACDIQCVETLAWSWKTGLKGCAVLLNIGIGIGILRGIIDNNISHGAMIGLLYASVPGLVLGTVAGLRTGVVEMKTVPNQGIRLSIRCALYGGLAVGLIASLICWLFATAVRSRVAESNGNAAAWDVLEGGLPYGLVLGLTGALICGWWFGGPDVIPHYFPHLKLYTKGRISRVLRLGLSVGLIACLILWSYSFTVASWGNLVRNASSGWNVLRQGLVDGSVLGLGVAVLAGSWFGGVDVILHYFLRTQLFLKGRTPLNLVCFLDYAAEDLNFLQKVGGGYIFIHRMLLEHFAAMQPAGQSNPQGSPAPAAST